MQTGSQLLHSLINSTDLFYSKSSLSGNPLDTRFSFVLIQLYIYSVFMQWNRSYRFPRCQCKPSVGEKLIIHNIRISILLLKSVCVLLQSKGFQIGKLQSPDKRYIMSRDLTNENGFARGQSPEITEFDSWF